MKPERAWVRPSPSGSPLNLLEPSRGGWQDVDLVVGLSWTYHWGSHSARELPLSVAQHSLAVLAIRRAQPGSRMSKVEELRELLHDSEGFLSFDCITQVKLHLGDGYARRVNRLQAANAIRYRLPDWSAEDYAQHKHADRLAAASAALHVVGWRSHEIRHTMEIEATPLEHDLLPTPRKMRPWQPWPPQIAAKLFREELNRLTVDLHFGHSASAMEAAYA